MKTTRKISRVLRVRKKIRAVSDRPRLTVYRTNVHIWAQVIDDKSGKVLAATSSKSLKVKGTKTEKSTIVGTEIAKLCLKAELKKVVFDRSGYRYHGRVKALAEAARSGGLEF